MLGAPLSVGRGAALAFVAGAVTLAEGAALVAAALTSRSDFESSLGAANADSSSDDRNAAAIQICKKTVQMVLLVTVLFQTWGTHDRAPLVWSGARRGLELRFS